MGAGRGARAGLVQGGLGSASLDLGDGLVVGALVAVNPVGSVFMPDGETFWAWPFEIDGEFGGRTPTGPAGRGGADAGRLPPGRTGAPDAGGQHDPGRGRHQCRGSARANASGWR
ncbi:P1 family peptidase [Caulobacter segnis]